MFEKVLALLVGGKLEYYAWYFEFMTLTLAAITGMAWAYCVLAFRKQKCSASGESSVIFAAGKGSDQ